MKLTDILLAFSATAVTLVAAADKGMVCRCLLPDGSPKDKRTADVCYHRDAEERLWTSGIYEPNNHRATTKGEPRDITAALNADGKVVPKDPNDGHQREVAACFAGENPGYLRKVWARGKGTSPAFVKLFKYKCGHKIVNPKDKTEPKLWKCNDWDDKK